MASQPQTKSHTQLYSVVIGSPRRPRGLISAPLEKAEVDDGKSERITGVDNVQNKRRKESEG